MNEGDCRSLAENANISLLTIIDIFYNGDYRFIMTDENDKSDKNVRNDVNLLYYTNNKAAETLEENLWLLVLSTKKLR